MSDKTGPLAVRGFISYSRTDNEVYGGIVDRLKLEIEGRFKAQTGQKLELFLDRESIGWGEDWRTGITTSIERGTLFIPIVTMNYFDSPHCREELMQFYTSANALGVVELLLPIVLAGKAHISQDSTSEEIRVVESRNYIDFAEAFEEGYDSKIWRNAVGRMVRDLEVALNTAEKSIVEIETTHLVKDRENPLDESMEYDIDDVAANVASFNEVLSHATDSASIFASSVSKALGDDLGDLTPGQRSSRMIVAAQDIRPHAEQLESQAREAKRLATLLDSQIRGIFTALTSFTEPSITAQRDLIERSVESVDIGEDAMDSIAATLEMMKFLGLTSVSLRKSLAPGIRGMESLRDTAGILSGWSSLAEQ